MLKENIMQMLIRLGLLVGPSRKELRTAIKQKCEEAQCHATRIVAKREERRRQSSPNYASIPDRS